MTPQGPLPQDRLRDLDFQAHNEEARAVWDAFHQRRSLRPPVILGTNTRFFMLNPSCNTGGLDFKTYTEDSALMFHTLLEFQRWSRFNLLQDAELGLPKEWSVAVDFQNYYEAAWFGCPVEYRPGQVPDTRPGFSGFPETLLEKGLPDPFGGMMGRGWEYHQAFTALAAREGYLGRAVRVQAPGLGVGTDGPLTVACNLFGPQEVLVLMASEPSRAERILSFITEATIRRVTAWRMRLGLPHPQNGYGFADDSVALISTPMYRDLVLPHHRWLCESLSGPGPRSVHLCGDSTRHFVLMRDELNIRQFDTGFPVDFSDLRKKLGPEVTIQGGPPAEFLRAASPSEVRLEAKRILGSGVLQGGRFVLREGNNLAPGTPAENTEALLQASREEGRKQGGAIEGRK